MPVGFDKNHQAGPNSSTAVGYRSKEWLNFGLSYNELSYNDFNFPPAISSKISVLPEYDKSERVIKWLAITLQIDFILTEFATTPADAGTEGNYGQITADSARTVMARLMQPGQALRFDAQGIGGTFRINDPTDTSGRNIKDLDNGPRPQLLDMQPLGGGNAFVVSWAITTHISPLTDVYIGPFVSFNYSATLDYDPSNFVIRTIKGEFELPSYQKTNDLAEQPEHRHFYPFGNAANGSATYVEKTARTYLAALFPAEASYIRTVSLEYDETHKKLSFSITDTQRKTDSWFPPGVGDFSLKQNLESDLKRGFNTWTLTYSGYIQAARGDSIWVGKQLAWFWLWQILATRRRNFEYTIQNLPPEELLSFAASTKDQLQEWNKWKPPGDLDIVSDLGGTEPTGTTPKRRTQEMYSGYIMPIRVSFDDDMYGNEISFSISFRVICTSRLLVKALNIFQPVQVPFKNEGLAENTWVTYLTKTGSANPLTDDIANVAPNNTVRTELLIDICTPLEEGSGISSSASPSDEDNTGYYTSASLLNMTRPTVGKDWEDYRCKFTFVEKAVNIISKILAPTGTIPNTDFISAVGKAIMSGIGNPNPQELQHKPFSNNPGGSENPPYKKTEVITPTEKTRYVIMEGYASRYCGPISPPQLLAVGDAIAYQDNSLGLDTVEIETVPLEMSTQNGELVDLYICKWKKYYVLDRTPSTGKVLTTAIPRRFV